MKIECNRETISLAFQTVGGITPSRAVKPVLQHVKLLAAKKGLELCATDLEVALRYHLSDLKVEQEGVVLVPFAKMNSLLREALDETIVVDSDQHICNLRCGKSRFKLLGCPAEEFPEIPSLKDEPGLEVASDCLREMIRKTAFAAAREKTRYALNGVLMKIAGTQLELVATDGRRLARVVRTVENPQELDKAVLLPVRGLQHLEKLVATGGDAVQLGFHENLVVMRTRSAELSVRLVEGAFPDYMEVIPSASKTSVRAKVGVFCAALRQASIMTGDETRAVRMTFHGESALLKTSAADIGESSIEVPVECEGPQQEISFNPDFLAEGLRVLSEDAEFTLQLQDRSSPGKVEDGGMYTYVIMPINIEG